MQRFAVRLREALGDDLLALWLYGSRDALAAGHVDLAVSAAYYKHNSS